MKRDILLATPFLFASLAMLASGHLFANAYGLDVGVGGSNNTGVRVNTPAVGIGTNANTNVGVSTPTVGVGSNSNIGTRTDVGTKSGVRVLRGNTEANADANINDNAAVSNRGSSAALDCPPSNTRNTRTNDIDCDTSSHAGARLGMRTGTRSALDTNTQAGSSVGTHTGVNTNSTAGVSVEQ